MMQLCYRIIFVFAVHLLCLLEVTPPACFLLEQYSIVLYSSLINLSLSMKRLLYS
jgi:hypothetical protein